MLVSRCSDRTASTMQAWRVQIAAKTTVWLLGFFFSHVFASCLKITDRTRAISGSWSGMGRIELFIIPVMTGENLSVCAFIWYQIYVVVTVIELSDLELRNVHFQKNEGRKIETSHGNTKENRNKLTEGFETGFVPKGCLTIGGNSVINSDHLSWSLRRIVRAAYSSLSEAYHTGTTLCAST